MVSFPFIAPGQDYDTVSLAAEVEEQGGEVDQITRWDQLSQTFALWSASSPAANPFPIDDRAGYFILVTQPTTQPFRISPGPLGPD